MTAIILVLLLIVTALSLGGSLFFCYRWLMRSRLFPQLPRLWRGDKTRFLIALGVFAVSLIGFFITSMLTPAPMAPLSTGPQAKKVGPSFDGQPPPAFPGPGRPAPQSQGEEKVLPPAPAPPALAGGGALPGIAPAPMAPAKAAPGPTQALVSTTSTTSTTAPPPPPAPAPQAKAPAPVQPKAQAETKTQAPAKAKPAPKPAAKPQAPAAKAPAPAKPQAETQAPAPTKPKTPAAKPPAQVKPKPQPQPPAGPYAVCVASFRQAGPARELAGQLKKKDLPARVAKVDLGAKGAWHRVLVGGYATSAQAAARAAAWRKQGRFKSPFVVRSP